MALHLKSDNVDIYYSIKTIFNYFIRCLWLASSQPKHLNHALHVGKSNGDEGCNQYFLKFFFNNSLRNGERWENV